MELPVGSAHTERGGVSSILRSGGQAGQLSGLRGNRRQRWRDRGSGCREALSTGKMVPGWERLRKAGVPEAIVFKTKPQIALELLEQMIADGAERLRF